MSATEISFMESVNQMVDRAATFLDLPPGLIDFYLNAGGVTVSYFEWIKNLSHIRFGRLERRFEEMRGRQIVQAIATMVGKPVPASFQQQLVRGADELDLVRSGLEDTMRQAYNEIREVFLSREGMPDLRTAAYVASLEKIALSYMEMGL